VTHCAGRRDERDLVLTPRIGTPFKTATAKIDSSGGSNTKLDYVDLRRHVHVVDRGAGLRVGLRRHHCTGGPHYRARAALPYTSCTRTSITSIVLS
jgi:hypothetical protein